MKIWIARHGETDLNAQKLMQGRADMPLNEKGKSQAAQMREKIKDIKFDAVFASPLSRAVDTAKILADSEDITIDERLIELDFGKYDLKKYNKIGLKMGLYYLFQQYLPAPKSVETYESIKERCDSFISDLLGKGYGNVLICSHGAFVRTMCQQLEEKRPKTSIKYFPKNCEIRVYEITDDGHQHHFVNKLNLED